MKYLTLDRIWAYFIGAILGFFEPIYVIIGWMLIFILVDMATGIYAAYCKNEAITSHKMQRTVIKFLMYGCSIVLLEGFDKYFIKLIDCGLAEIGASIICGIELYSVFENCYKATGNEVFKILTTMTREKVEIKTGVKIKGKGKGKKK